MTKLSGGGVCFASFFILLAAVARPESAVAQVENQGRKLEPAPTVFFDAIVLASDKPGKSQLDMYVQVPHEEIRFVKEGEVYLGRYEISIGITTPKQEPVWSRTVSVDVTLKDFSQTVSNRLYSLKQLSAELDPGTYELDIQIRDADSKKTSRARRSILVSEFLKDSLSLSDIMLVNRVTTDGEKKTIIPNISGNVGHLSEGFFLFFEAYHPATIDSLLLNYKILNLKRETLAEKSELYAATGMKTQVFLKVQNLNLPVGAYLAYVETAALPKNVKDTVKLHATTSRAFSVRWSDIPFTITDMDKAIDQLRYVAKESEMDYMREAKSPDEKKRRFLEFWTKRDPDKQTPRNELMEEYYERVDYANRTFSHYTEGWRSDMGMVYIRFGAPENVERHPFETGTRPYEVWYYYQQNREFIFVDESGFGDYRLKYPTTDLWGRVR